MLAAEAAELAEPAAELAELVAEVAEELREEAALDALLARELETALAEETRAEDAEDRADEAELPVAVAWEASLLPLEAAAPPVHAAAVGLRGEKKSQSARTIGGGGGCIWRRFLHTRLVTPTGEQMDWA